MKRRKVLGIAAGTALGASAAIAGQAETGFKPIFNGKDLTGIKLHGITADTLKVNAGVLECSGKPNGYWYTEKSYKNYTLRFDYRYKRPEGLADENAFLGNSGYLIHIVGEHKVWPKCVEVQGMNRDVCAIFAIGGATGPRDNGNAEVRKTTRKPVGEWNSLEIISADGKLTASLNGVKLCEGGPYDVTEGTVGFQSEGAEIHWRNLRIKEA